MTQIRLNSGGSTSGDARRETEDGVEYLVAPATIAREGVLSYEDQSDAFDHELLPGEEFTPASRWNGLPMLVDHPTTAVAGTVQPASTTSPGASSTDVGEFRDAGTGSDGESLGGEVWIRTNERDQHGPGFKRAFDDLEDGEEVQVSPGYGVGRLDATEGRHNGKSYSGIQRDLEPDHVAVVISGRARCSIEAGCSIGQRANAEQDTPSAAFGEPIITDSTMSNQQHSERDKGAIAGALETIGSTFGIGVETSTRANARSSARTPEYDETLAEDDMGPDDFVSTHWMLDDYIDAYAEQTDEDVPADVHSALSDGVSQDAREWIAKHTLLGNADAETEPNLLLFDVVSPDGVLHESKLRDVLGEDGARATLPDELREAARDEAGRLLNEEFGDGDGGDSDDEQDGTTDDTDRENATQYDESDVVEYDDGKMGVVLAVMTSDFSWPQGDEDETDVEASSESPMYVVARESRGSAVFEASELSSGSFDADEPDLDDLRENAVVPEWYDTLDDPSDYDEVHGTVRGNANIPGVDDPEVGFAPGEPEGWTRKSYLQAYASLGGSWRSCVTEMTGDVSRPKRWCSALKDEVFGTERWRGGRFNAAAAGKDTESDDAADTAAADSGRTTTETDTQDTMHDPELPDDPTDEQKIDYLTDEDGPDLDRENMEPLEGEDCLDTIFEDYRRLNAATESEEGGESEAETTEGTDEPGNDDTTEGTDDDEPAVTFDSREEFEAEVADVIESRENAKEEQSLIDWIDERSERYNAEMLDGTPSGVLEEIADDVAEEQRTNATGPNAQGPTPPQADRSAMQTEGGPRMNAGEETPDVPAGGNPWTDDSATEEADD